MIYRPTQISEAKAIAIENIIKDRILSERRTEPAANSEVVDAGLRPAEGLHHAITQRIEYLKRRKERLEQLLIKRESTTSGTEEDLIDPEY